MTDTLSRVVVPYADFLEHRERRRATAAEMERQNDQRTIDTHAVPSPVSSEGADAAPLLSQETRPAENPAPVHNAERIT
jgi:hypothetical protein